MENLIKRIKKFCADRKTTDNEDRPKVTREELKELEYIIYGILDLKWENSDFSDRSVHVRIEDCTKGIYYWVPFIPYRTKGIDKELEIIDDIITAAAQPIKEARTRLKILKIHRQQQKKKLN